MCTLVRGLEPFMRFVRSPLKPILTKKDQINKIALHNCETRHSSEIWIQIQGWPHLPSPIYPNGSTQPPPTLTRPWKLVENPAVTESTIIFLKIVFVFEKISPSIFYLNLPSRLGTSTNRVLSSEKSFTIHEYQHLFS